VKRPLGRQRRIRQFNVKLGLGRAMAQAVSHRHLRVEVRFRARVSPCEITDGQSGTGRGFSPIYSVSPVNVIPPWLSVLISGG
jgi:hypothetical protein